MRRGSEDGADEHRLRRPHASAKRGRAPQPRRHPPGVARRDCRTPVRGSSGRPPPPPNGHRLDIPATRSATALRRYPAILLICSSADLLRGTADFNPGRWKLQRHSFRPEDPVACGDAAASHEAGGGGRGVQAGPQRPRRADRRAAWPPHASLRRAHELKARLVGHTSFTDKTGPSSCCQQQEWRRTLRRRR